MSTIGMINGTKSVLEKDDIKFLKNKPRVNVIDKDTFEERIYDVFKLLGETLSKSFGPYGAPTLIYNYPYSHVTKDGFTIMKNLSMDASESKIDQAIADMAGDICGRLNTAVGDGTTSAIIATNSIYSSYYDIKDEFRASFVLPRDILFRLNNLKDKIASRISTKVRQIRSDDMDELYENIKNVVYVSSNGDELITEYIASLYKELGSPSISCSLATDGVTKKIVINGYKYDLVLNDRLYINNDNNTMELYDSDIVIFSTKITSRVYEKILKPLNMQSKIRGRHLIVCAPSYDEKALKQTIAIDLNKEYNTNHDVNMVLTTYRANSSHARKLVNDFSVLMGTTVIDKALEEIILEELSVGTNIQQIFNIDTRDDIYGLKCAIVPENGEETTSGLLYNKGIEEIPEGYVEIVKVLPMLEEHTIRLGFVKKCALGLNNSLFSELVYDKKRYEVILKEAEDSLNDAINKYKKLGTFNLEVGECQDRLYTLRLKTGQIEVGGDSDLSQKMLKDAVDDSIKAASSAFYHGVVLGCNVNLIQIIDDLINECEEPIDTILLKMIKDGFIKVYMTVLDNAFNNITYDSNKQVVEAVIDGLDNKTYSSDLIKLVKENSDTKFSKILSNYSININKVFDLSTYQFTENVINSSQTDIEILTATIDLIGLLIVGNQMVVTQKHNF